MKSSLLICIALVGSKVVFGQQFDTTNNQEKNPIASFFSEKEFNSAGTNYTSIDTSLDRVQKYFPNNFTYSLGLSSRKIKYASSSEIGFRSGINNFDLFDYTTSQVKYYHTRAPLTEVMALFGMKKEQYAKLLHTQNITKEWNVALSMLRIRSEGFYQRQNSTNNNISFSTNYFSKNNRYSLLASGLVSSIKADENGGIKNDSSFENLISGNKKLLPIRLSDARSKSRNREVFMKQSIHFGKKEVIRKGDSIISSHLIPTTRISYSFQARDNFFAYSEGKIDSAFYENTFYDSIRTKDSTLFEEYSHSLEFQTTLFKKIVFTSCLTHRNTTRLIQYNADSSRILDTNFLNQLLNLEIGSVVNRERDNWLSWKLSRRYIYGGSQAGDEFNFAYLGYTFKKNKTASVEIGNTFRSVPYIYSQYNSNHFWWENSFDKISETNINLLFSDIKNKYSLGIQSNQVDGYVYFDNTFSPTQFDSTLTVLSGFAQKNIKLKHFNFNNKITWQHTSNDIIRLPKIIAEHSFYYEGKWFKKAVLVQLGIDILYYSGFYGDAYMPAMRQYYLQNERELGNYPFIDFFFCMKVKQARIFFKTEHINSGFTGSNYFLAPHMPAPDRSIKIGIRWMFFD